VSALFDAKHPDFERWEARWRKAYDFYRAGLHVVEPVNASGKVSFYSSTKTEDGLTNVSYQERGSNSYLWGFARESEATWRDRNQRITHYPILRPLVAIFRSSIFRVQPSRKMPGGGLTPEWRAYLEDVDLAGKSMDAMSSGVVSWGLCFGRCYAVTDVPRVDAPPTTMREQRKRGIRPYTYAITPMELEDWTLDPYGHFNWARLRETELDTRGPLQAPGELSPQYRIWTREGWEVYRRQRNKSGSLSSNGRWALVDNGPGPKNGLIPIQPFFADRTESRSSHDSDTPLASQLDIDVEVLNLFSLLNEQEFASTFPQLVVESNGNMGDIDMGPGFGVEYPEGGRPPAYIEPNPGTASGLFARIMQRLDMAKRTSGSSRGVAEWSKEQRSPGALDIEYQDRYALLAGIASAAEDFEDGVFSHVAAWTGDKIWPKSKYGRRFDMRSVSSQIADALNSDKLPLGPVVKGMINSELVERILKEMGVSDDDRRKAIKLVKEESEKPVPAPVVATEPDEEREQDPPPGAP